jgi:hypothetical protein
MAIPARWRRPPSSSRPITPAQAGRGALAGMAAGVVGAAVMAAATKLEQQVTHRPDSFVPGHTLSRLLGLPRPDEDRVGRNWAMHFGTGALAGALRGTMAAAGLRGPWTSAMFAVVRLSIDQTLENATGVGAPPPTWPRDELAIDLSGKLVYALATGVVADRLVTASR